MKFAITAPRSLIVAFIISRRYYLVKSDRLLDPPSPVITTIGQVNVTYTAIGCSGEDSLTASLVGGTGEALGVIDVAEATARSITFVSATPDTIVLQGTGGGPTRQKSSTVIFRVFDNNNAPVSGVRVNFGLTTEIGSLDLSPTSAVSNSEGEVSVTVFSGNIPTSVRVVASINVNGRTLSTVSDILVVSTGLPVQNSISLSVVDGFDVPQGFTSDGVRKVLTVRLADRFNNPVPDGTAASFVTEYGTIDPSCSTGTRNGERLVQVPENITPILPGECSVLWTSGEPRTPTLDGSGEIRRIDRAAGYSCPSHNGRPTGSNGGFPCPDDLGPVRGGHSTVLVYAIGEESFIDRNGNGIMDREERHLFENLPEAFLDHNQDGRFNPVADCRDRRNSLACISGFEETFIDFNNDGVYSYNDDVDPDGNPTGEPPAVYNGLLCPPAGDGVWCSRDLVNVRDDIVLFLSAEPDWAMILVNQSRNVVSGTTEGPTFNVYVSDVFNNRPPAGSTINVSTTGDCVIESESQITVPVSASYGAFAFELITSGDGGGGRVVITLDPAGDSTPFTKSFNCTSTAPPPEGGDDDGLSLGG